MRASAIAVDLAKIGGPRDAPLLPIVRAIAGRDGRAEAAPFDQVAEGIAPRPFNQTEKPWDYAPHHHGGY